MERGSGIYGVAVFWSGAAATLGCSGSAAFFLLLGLPNSLTFRKRSWFPNEFDHKRIFADRLSCLTGGTPAAGPWPDGLGAAGPDVVTALGSVTVMVFHLVVVVINPVIQCPAVWWKSELISFVVDVGKLESFFAQFFQ